MLAKKNEPTKFESPEANEPWWRPAVLTFLKTSVWIAAPVIMALYIGKWLDRKYDTSPWLFLACTGFAFLISMFGLIKNAIVEFKKIDEAGKKKTDKNNN